ncbi:Dam family site-specific DNA-(adenine-N6)-methyltransferase [Xanthomonas campestris pv. cannae]|nr:Dam family site-specific DNA-(adenine-N6)-methyltransferase [Xanthomonas campestris pv. cannae]
MRDSQDSLPFLKWAGGKRWLAKSCPNIFSASRNLRYVEPFLGSGAIFFSLGIRAAMLNDVNAELIDTYIAIRDNWSAVNEKLKEHHASHSPEHFYKVRSQFPRTQHERAARFIYLNRTCFNGLYRVNVRGEFNVPIGTKSNVILDTDNFEKISKILADVDLRSEDFEVIVNECGEGDFIFADPPYTVRHNNNGFVKYNEKLFSWADQERLKAALASAVGRGALVVVSNADHPSIRELYKGFRIDVLERQSVMASESARRKATTEVLIRMGQ